MIERDGYLNSKNVYKLWEEHLSENIDNSVNYGPLLCGNHGMIILRIIQ